jgi:hypothetical protein
MALDLTGPHFSFFGSFKNLFREFLAILQSGKVGQQMAEMTNINVKIYPKGLNKRWEIVGKTEAATLRHFLFFPQPRPSGRHS